MWTKRAQAILALELRRGDQLDLLEVADLMVERGHLSGDPLTPRDRRRFARDYARVERVERTDQNVYVMFENTHPWILPETLAITPYPP